MHIDRKALCLPGKEFPGRFFGCTNGDSVYKIVHHDEKRLKAISLFTECMRALCPVLIEISKFLSCASEALDRYSEIYRNVAGPFQKDSTSLCQ